LNNQDMPIRADLRGYMSKGLFVSGNKGQQLIILCLIFVLVCGVIVFEGYKLLESLEFVSGYDPKDAAIEKVTQCLDDDGENQQETSGLITYFPGWDAIKQSADKTNNQYSVDVLWYNWEDQIPNRGGDEVYLQVSFSDDNVFRILWYEGGLEYCESSVQ
jgi:hypothetical protein